LGFLGCGGGPLHMHGLCAALAARAASRCITGPCSRRLVCVCVCVCVCVRERESAHARLYCLRSPRQLLRVQCRACSRPGRRWASPPRAPGGARLPHHPRSHTAATRAPPAPRLDLQPSNPNPSMFRYQVSQYGCLQFEMRSDLHPQGGRMGQPRAGAAQPHHAAAGALQHERRVGLGLLRVGREVRALDWTGLGLTRRRRRRERVLWGANLHAARSYSGLAAC
jgi:hypothetical protein